MCATISQLLFRFNQFKGCIENLRNAGTKGDDVAHQKYTLTVAKSSLSLLSLDLTLGLLLGIVLWSYPDMICTPLARLYSYMNDRVIQSGVSWLMSSPVGLQFNRNLVLFLGTVSLTMVSYWDALFENLCSALSPIIISRFLACISFIGGASMMLSVIVDLSSIAFFHVIFVYAGLARFWNLWVRVTYSLLLLFQGKKYNVLKSRIDIHEFDIEELTLGTVFLSISLFTMPTIFIFYLTFMTIWLVVLFTQFLLRICIASVSFFPVYLWIIADSIPYKTILAMDGSRKISQVYVPLPRATLLQQFLAQLSSTVKLDSSTSAAFVSVMRGTWLVFPKNRQHEVDSVRLVPTESVVFKTQ